MLGHLLFTGIDGMSQQRAKGLMWLTLSKEGALLTKDGRDQWIVDLYEKDLQAASDSDRDVAQLYLDDHRRRN